MAGPGLPVNIDTTYADSGTDPSVKIHQQNSDTTHTYINKHDTSFLTGTSGQFLAYNGSGLVAPIAAPTGSGNPDGLYVQSYSVVGNGTADDTTALQNAINAAQATGVLLSSPAGLTFLISSTLTIGASCTLHFNGSTIKKASTMTSDALNISGANVTLSNLNIDGNRSGGATGNCSYWQAAGGKAYDCNFSHAEAAGFNVQGSSAQLTAYRCTASDNSSGVGGGHGDGFMVWVGGLLVTYDCEANDNWRNGFYFTSSADGCRLSGRASRNIRTGAAIEAGHGTCDYFYADSNHEFGLTLDNHPDNWNFGYVETSNTGVAIPGYAQNGTATGVELYGATNCKFGTINSHGMLGYGLAVTSDSVAGANNNSFGTVIVNLGGAPDSDPAIHFSGGSNHNSIGTAHVVGTTEGLELGEAGTGDANFNTVGVLTLDQISYVGVRMDSGTSNYIGRIVAKNCTNSDPTNIGRGIVDFQGTSSYNIIGSLEYSDDVSLNTSPPQYLAHAATTAYGNVVQDGIAQGFTTAAGFDENGGNSFTFRPPRRVSQILTLDSGETWTNATDDTTSGHFIQGTGGKHIVGSSGFTGAVYTFGSNQDYSGIDGNASLRLWVYITNLSDAGNSTGMFIIRFTAPAGGTNYFQKAYAAARLVNGGQFVYMRKSDFTVAGTVGWNQIKYVSVLLYGATGTITATVDDFAWFSPIGSPSPASAFTTSGPPSDRDFPTPKDGVMAVDTVGLKLYVRLGGVWKSTTLT
jgi:hypothetical protein